MKKFHRNISDCLFILFSCLLFVGFFLTKYNVNSSFLHFLWFMGFGGLFFMMTMKSFFTGFLINSSLLFILPILLAQSNIVFIDQKSTWSTLSIISYFFLITMIDFLIMAYHISNRVFLRVLLLFLQYLILLFSILVTFAILYAYLGNMSNEGIESNRQIIQNWDALYFSATTFFTIGYGDITPQPYSSVTKSIIIVQAAISHLVTTILWPVIIIFASRSFNKNK